MDAEFYAFLRAGALSAELQMSLRTSYYAHTQLIDSLRGIDAVVAAINCMYAALADIPRHSQLYSEQLTNWLYTRGVIDCLQVS